jgi:hypothetical protein
VKGHAEDPNALVITQVPVPEGILTPAEAALVTGLAARRLSASTRDAYLRDWKLWAAWCAARGEDPVPVAPEKAALWITEQSLLRKPDGTWRFAAPTIGRRAAALTTVGTAAAGSLAAAAAPAGRHPLVQSVLAGMRKDRKDTRQHKAGPLLPGDLRVICAVITAGATTWSRRARARRDIAVLTALVAGAYRRSELAAHQLHNVTCQPGVGLHMYVSSSKTDGEGTGMVKVLPSGEDPDPLICPACAMLRWIQVAQAWDEHGRPGLIRLLAAPDPAPPPGTDAHACRQARALPVSDAPLLRGVRRSGLLTDGGLTGHAVNDIVQARAAEASLDPGRLLTGHSGRVGFVVQSLRDGEPVDAIARQTGHRKREQVYDYGREYVPEAGNAAMSMRSRF